MADVSNFELAVSPTSSSIIFTNMCGFILYFFFY